ncbi:predicted protein [Uncinocarpus reesii 1704]|uniref:Uncharacterized protein n=1 Tax=Uncinocarpus reesii (strain UAMH 1704) TaxID=336963 RepID=C4JZ69_UNCRE|nr:uncharacterized protein UREG_07470 [Uncinocarpus reesii 1704]EEP82605.1 predicted protein [Uncinocarpus reesii 1704]
MNHKLAVAILAFTTMAVNAGNFPNKMDNIGKGGLVVREGKSIQCCQQTTS